MPDLTKCTNSRCVKKWDCYRWTCDGDILQSYDIFAPENNTVENFSCDMFLEVRK